MKLRRLQLEIWDLWRTKPDWLIITAAVVPCILIGLVYLIALSRMVAIEKMPESIAPKSVPTSDDPSSSAISGKHKQFIDQYIEDYTRDPHETIFKHSLERVPKDDVIGETYLLTRRMRFAKSAYDWSFIEMETDVSTDKQWFEISFSSWIQSSPFPYVKGKPGEWGKLMSFNRWPEEEKYEPGTDGRIEWLITPKVEFGRKTLTLQFRCLR